jgi:hypothetical protein
MDDIGNLHENILKHSMYRPHGVAVWNLDGQGLLLGPTFDFDVPASVSVVLDRVSLYIKHDPIFHRTGTFA